MLDMLTPRQNEQFFKRGFVRLSELTGDPGDIVIGHPWLLHSAAVNCGTQPRFLFLQRIKPREPSVDEPRKAPHRAPGTP